MLTSSKSELNGDDGFDVDDDEAFPRKSRTVWKCGKAPSQRNGAAEVPHFLVRRRLILAQIRYGSFQAGLGRVLDLHG